ncbi:MAG: dipeptidase PepE [Flavobacteriaceae bacterium]|nr:dipeptidase PepE [Flavobacteriaceae bacterium]
MKHIIIASTSTVHGSGFLEYILNDLEVFFQHTDSILFIPYARPSGISHDEYTAKASDAFSKIGKKVKGIHTFKDPVEAVQKAKGIFVGGGNTFVLVNKLYKHNLIDPIQAAVTSGTPYVGTSAGSNICGLNIRTTNDMPIVYPPSFKTFGFVPFNINPHYLDPNPESTHMGETRATRIKEFHKYNTQPVVGLREGSYLEINGTQIILKGLLKARVFEHNKTAYEVLPQSDLSGLQ